MVGTSLAAAMLDVHPATVTRMAQDGRLTPVTRIGTALVFSAAEVEKLREAREAAANAPVDVVLTPAGEEASYDPDAPIPYALVDLAEAAS